MTTPTSAPNVVVVAGTHKSMALALVLVFLFGPLGYLYVNVFWGLVLMALYFVLSLVSFGLFLPVAILLNFGLMIVAGVAVSMQNKATTARIANSVRS